MLKQIVKPCPFCGKELEVSLDDGERRGRCATRQCKGSKLPMLRLDSPSDIAAWNMRDGCYPVPSVSLEVAHQIAHKLSESYNGNYFFYHEEMGQFLDLLAAAAVQQEVPHDDDSDHPVREDQPDTGAGAVAHR